MSEMNLFLDDTRFFVVARDIADQLTRIAEALEQSVKPSGVLIVDKDLTEESRNKLMETVRAWKRSNAACSCHDDPERSRAIDLLTEALRTPNQRTVIAVEDDGRVVVEKEDVDIDVQIRAPKPAETASLFNNIIVDDYGRVVEKGKVD